MAWLKQDNRKMLLGQLLIEENLISEGQLALAINQQKKTGQRLGDVIAEWDLIPKKQVAAVLRKQRTLRFVASIVTALLGPLPAHVATAATPAAPITAKAAPAAQKQAGVRALAEKKPVNQGSPVAVATSGLEVVEYDQDAAWGLWANTLAEQDFRFMALEPMSPATVPASGLSQAIKVRPDFLVTQPPLEQGGMSPEERKDAALQVVELRHSRVADAIRNMWGYKECSDYINRLVLSGNDGNGHARMGFSQDAVEAMLVLVDIHDQLFPSRKTDAVPFLAKSAKFSGWGGLA